MRYGRKSEVLLFSAAEDWKKKKLKIRYTDRFEYLINLYGKENWNISSCWETAIPLQFLLPYLQWDSLNYYFLSMELQVSKQFSYFIAPVINVSCSLSTSCGKNFFFPLLLILWTNVIASQVSWLHLRNAMQKVWHSYRSSTMFCYN